VSAASPPASPVELPTLALMLASVAWGLSWLPLKALAAGGVAGLALILVASSTAGLAILPLAWRRHRPARGARAALLAIATLGGYANLSFALALMHGEVVRVMVLFYLLPVWAALGGRVFLGERLTPVRLLAVALAVAGAVLTLGGTAALAAPLGWTDLLALSCGLSFALGNLVFRAFPTMPLPGKVTAMQLGSAALAGAALAAGLEPLPAAAPQTLGWAAAYGLGWLLLATLGTQWGVTHLPAARAAVIITLELVTAAVSATVLGLETWTPQKAAGVALILAATVVEGRSGAGDRPPGDPPERL
jgi:drug/metabolite transporter (DMT)-like permease